MFIEQLELAEQVGLPVIVHSRAAEQETAELLSDFRGSVVLHCFSSPALLPVALERGYYVSFAGNVTYPKAEELREAAREVPADRLLAETGSPYLSPQPRRGRPQPPRRWAAGGDRQPLPQPTAPSRPPERAGERRPHRRRARRGPRRGRG